MSRFRLNASLALLLSVALLLAACSPDRDSGLRRDLSDRPAVQLIVHTHDGTEVRLGSTRSPVTVSPFPTFEVRVMDRLDVYALHYSIDGSTWQPLGLDHLGRVRFSPALPLTEQHVLLQVRAINTDSQQTIIANEFRVDATPPVLTRVQVAGQNLLGSLNGAPVRIVLPEDTRSAHVSARASDGPYAGEELRVVLEQGGAVLYESDGGLLEYGLVLEEDRDGAGLSLYAVDSAGNRSGYVNFSIEVEKPAKSEDEADNGNGDDGGNGDEDNGDTGDDGGNGEDGNGG